MASNLHACFILCLLIVVHTMDRVASRRFRRQTGLQWFRECSFEYDVPINADEGIIETPVPGPFRSNCGDPLKPGVCCRWRINISDPKLYVEIAVLDSTLPMGPDGKCSNENMVSIMDVTRREVEAVCGPVSFTRTVIVPSAGALIGFRGLIQDGSMATLHYKVVGCGPLPPETNTSPRVVSVLWDPLTANVTCSNGRVHFIRCIDHVWHPPPGDLTCHWSIVRKTTQTLVKTTQAQVSTTTAEPTTVMWTTKTMHVTTGGPPPSDVTTETGRADVTVLQVQPTEQSQTPSAAVHPIPGVRYDVHSTPGVQYDGHRTSSVPYDVLTEVIASETEPATAQGGRGMNGTQLALIIVGTLAVVLLLCIFLVLILRRPRKKQSKHKEPVTKENAYQVTSILPPVDDGYTDLYDEIGPYCESEPYVPPEPERTMIRVRPPYQYYPADEEEVEPLDLTEELVRSLDMVDDIVEDILAEDPYAVPDKDTAPDKGTYDNPDSGTYDNPDSTGTYDNPDNGTYDNADNGTHDSGTYDHPDEGIYDNADDSFDNPETATGNTIPNALQNSPVSDSYAKSNKDTNSGSDSEAPAVPEKHLDSESDRETLYSVTDKENNSGGIGTNKVEEARMT